jgi:hypothetical protein
LIEDVADSRRDTARYRRAVAELHWVLRALDHDR